MPLGLKKSGKAPVFFFTIFSQDKNLIIAAHASFIGFCTIYLVLAKKVHFQRCLLVYKEVGEFW